jgi:glutaredoxin-like protein NrdH
MVTIYTLPACVQCDNTKRFLSRKLINYKEIDMSKDLEALQKIKELGFTQAPVVEYGEDVWSGFRFDKLNSLAA